MKNTIFLLFFATFLLFSFEENTTFAPKQTLSEYGFFKGEMKDLQPNDGIFEYEVNAPLFSDYAEKKRFIALPPNGQLIYKSEGAFDCPIGTTIIKNFYYSNDQSQPEQGRRILETRLLIKETKGWKALEYVWNEAQTEAVLEVAGANAAITWKNKEGKNQQLDYLMPNLNQCKGCHSFDGQFVLLGLTAKQLNKDVFSGQETENQLIAWQKKGILSELPLGLNSDGVNQSHPITTSEIPKMPAYHDAKNPDLNAKARAYLDANCAHCHNAHGPASTSGLMLNFEETNPQKIGIRKPPIAAGRASGNLAFDILPGKPNESILLARMESEDTGIRMPELGRSLVDKEGVLLIKEWIKAMEN
jgi:uncharacterized repeat protein (TIGR03806 family)